MHKSNVFYAFSELFPHIFTWACDPKEASAHMIKKYITQHFPNLSPDIKLKKAIEGMVNRGQLEQITGMLDWTENCSVLARIIKLMKKKFCLFVYFR